MSDAVRTAGVKTWYAGARPRTLGVSVCPVAVGSAVAAALGHVIVWRALAALVVSLALQVGANYANDVSDGVRGTDSPERVGPTRLVATGLATPTQVRLAAGICFGIAAVAGLALAVAVNPWLLAVGAASILAAVAYTGGSHPYGYSGFGEIAVLAFFGVVGTCGSTYVQLERVPLVAFVASLVVGLGAVAILLANNLRDIETDEVAGKHTLAVRLGRPRATVLYTAVVVAMFAGIVVVGIMEPWALVALVALPLGVVAVRRVRRASGPPALLAALVDTARLQLLTCLLLAVGLWAS